jgi:hypothetical protein
MKHQMLAWASLSIALTAFACDQSRKAAPPSPPPAQVAPAPAPGSPPPDAAPLKPGVHPALANEVPPAQAEAEIFGAVKIPKAASGKGRVLMFVADNDCLADDAHALGGTETKGKKGEFFVEVLPKWGSTLTLCAFLETKPGEPATFYGKAPKAYKADQPGEIVITKVVIPLEKKPRHTFPTFNVSHETQGMHR